MKKPNSNLRRGWILAMLLLTSCISGSSATSLQVEAVDRFREVLGLPGIPVEQLETTGMANSPSGRLKVVVYQDGEGREFSVDPATNQVVEMDARALLPRHGSILPDAAALDEDTLRSAARKYVSALVPDFAALEGRWRYEENVKGDNCFFAWYGDSSAASMNRPFAQLGIHRSGLVFAYYNTLLLEK
jgi:hypothetical protein